eukprot:TCONS_00059559-protein
MGGDSKENTNKQLNECIRNARQMLDVSIKVANKKFDESIINARMKFEESIASSKHILNTSVTIAKQALEDSINEVKTHSTTTDDESFKMNSSKSFQQNTQTRNEGNSNAAHHSNSESTISTSNIIPNSADNGNICDKIKREIIDYANDGTIERRILFSQRNDCNKESPMNNIKMETEDNVCGMNNPFLTVQPQEVNRLQENLNCRNFEVPTTVQTPSKSNYIDVDQDKLQERLKCTTCGIAFLTKYLLDKHTCRPLILNKNLSRPHLRSDTKRLGQKQNTSVLESFAAIDRKFKCDFCKNVFPNQKFLNNHVKRKHNPKVQFKCDICEKSFVKQARLNRHLNVHKGINFTCKVCGSSFARKVHLNIHKGIKPFKCKFCGDSFRKKKALKKHEEMHAELKQGQVDSKLANT